MPVTPAETPSDATLLVVSEEPETAAALTSRLRAQRFEIAVEPLGSPEDLETREIAARDLVVWDARAPWPLSEVSARLEARRLDPPLLALLPALEPARLGALAREGARDVIALDAPEHLGAVIRRELAVAGARAERRRLAESCQELRTNWETTLHALPLPAALLHDGMHVFVNEAYRRFFGRADTAVTPFLGLFPKGEQDILKKALRTAVRATSHEVLELAVPHPDDPRGVVRLYLSAEMHEGQPAVLALLQPAPAAPPAPPAPPAAPDEDTASGARPAKAAEVPPASGLEIPARFVARIEEYLRSSPPKRTVQALLMVGVDDYVRLVDDYGPLVGESVLKQIEQRLLRELLPLEFATRLGRDHYLWLQRPHHEGVEVFADALVAHLNEHVYESGGHSLHVSCRVGWADRRQCGDVWNLVGAAHQAFVRGAGQPVSHYVPSVAGVDRPEQVAGAFRRLLEERRLGLTLEAVSPIRTDARERPFLLEAAMGEPLDALPRRDLFTIVKRTGLLRAHDRWLVAQAIGRQPALAAERGPGLVLAVRLSGETLDDGEFLPWLESGAGASPPSPGGLLFLVSERTAAGRLKAIGAFVAEAARHGFRTGFYDFGAGPQALGLLRTVRPSFLILHESLSAGLAPLAALEPAKRAQSAPLGTLLEAARAAGAPVAAPIRDDALAEIQAAHTLGLSYVLSGTTETLVPPG